MSTFTLNRLYHYFKNYSTFPHVFSYAHHCLYNHHDDDNVFHLNPDGSEYAHA